MTSLPGQIAPLLEALSFAAAKHRDQRRKGVGAVPYINHPIQVAEVLATTAGIEHVPTLMAAVLHDTVEDTDTTHEELSDRFGSEVAGLVSEVTDDKSLEREARKQAQVDHAPHLSQPAMLIKMADKICNVRDIGSHPPVDWSVERRLAYFNWAEAVVNGCRTANDNLATAFDEAVRRSRGLLTDH